MRADRLLSILLILQNHGRVTARVLAKRLEVCERTVHRDMSALGSAGVPVVADRGAGGGWSLMPGYRASIGALNEAEVRALFVGMPALLLDDLHLHRASDDAALKLLSALPSVTRKSAELARQRIHIDLSGWKRSRDPVPFLPLLQEAVWSDRRVRFRYPSHPERSEGHGGAGGAPPDPPGPSLTLGATSHERIGDPFGLVAKGSIWYVVARVHGEMRTYRISRIVDAVVLDETFVRPADFDLANHWTASAAQFKEKIPRYEVVVRTNNARYLELMIRYGAIDRVDGDIAYLHFDSEEMAVVSLIAFDGEVVEPRALRDKIVAAARTAITRYAE